MSNLLFKETDEICFYQKPPLVFQGNKKQIIRVFKQLMYSYKDYILRNNIRETDIIFLDCFGGSGLLSNTIKCVFLKSLVVWNDFDNYQQRLDNIEITNEICKEIKQICAKYRFNSKISTQDKEIILNIIESYREKYTDSKIDYISLGSFLLFSGCYVKDFESLKKSSFFWKKGEANKNKKGYLAGVKRESMDFKELIAKYKKIAKMQNKILFLILDPPYLQTNTECYTPNYYTLKEFLYLMEIVEKPFVLFSSERSDIKPFIEWWQNKFNALKEVKMFEFKSILNKAQNAEYCFFEF